MVEYVLKHTWGYQEYGLTKHITTNEFMHGRQRKDGSRMDRGTGLSKPSVIDGLKKAVIHGYLVESVDASDCARIRKSYALKMLTSRGEDYDPPSSLGTYPTPNRADVKNLDTGVKILDNRGEESLHRSKKDTLERHFIKPLNGDESLFKKLPKLNQPGEKTEYIVQSIIKQLGDTHSKRFYTLIASRIPEEAIYQALSEIKEDGADHPPKLFTHKMKMYAIRKQKESIASG